MNFMLSSHKAGALCMFCGWASAICLTDDEGFEMGAMCKRAKIFSFVYYLCAVLPSVIAIVCVVLSDDAQLVVHFGLGGAPNRFVPPLAYVGEFLFVSLFSMGIFALLSAKHRVGELSSRMFALGVVFAVAMVLSFTILAIATLICNVF